MPTDDQLLVDVLRAAGHYEAANLAGKLLERTAAEPSDDAQPPSPASPHLEAQQDTEARALRDALNRGIGSKWTSGGKL